MKLNKLKMIFLIVTLFSVNIFAEVLNVLIEKELDDDKIIIVTSKGDRLLLEKWTMKLSPLSFEGKIFPAKVSPMWVKMYIENKGEIKWSIEKHLGTVNLKQPKNNYSSSARQDGYIIQVANNDELFIINGETFKAQTYCLGWEQGEKVKFIKGSAFGACASAKLLNLNRGEICDVWCE